MDASAPTFSSAGADRDLLRIVACGSVDDGKSTLIGRLLVETGSVPIDQLTALERLSRRFGTTGDDVDYALLLDGLEAEREQGITIDVAYRFFGTARRAFVVADTPGHEQYTRNMATGASNADLAVLLVDARNGLTTQTMRHSRIVALLGIRRVLLVVNKMDLVGFDPAAFYAVRQAYERFAATLGPISTAAVPVAARHGDNVAAASTRMPWYDGPTVLSHLEHVDVGATGAASMRFPVQAAVRTEDDFRGCAGTVASGTVGRGDRVVVARTGQEVRIERIVTFDGDIARAERGRAVTLVLDAQVDVARGDLLAAGDTRPDVTDQIAAHIVWLDGSPLLPGRGYALKIGTQTVPATVTAVKHKIEVETGHKAAGRTLEINEIGFCNVATSAPIALDPYSENRATGAFILIDRYTAATVGAGMVAFALRRAGNVKHQYYKVDKTQRTIMKGHRPCMVWFTGLPGAGKSTIMNLVEQRLAARGVHTYALDGDNLRQGLNRDLGFTDADRVENIRRVGEVGRLMVDAGLVTLCAFVSPFRAERRMVRELMAADEFVEVFVDTPIAVCIDRDPKGLYAKARAGKVMHVTGVDSPYEAPEHPELRLDTTADSAEQLANRVVAALEARGLVRDAT